MTPTDSLPARLPGATDPGAVRQNAQRGARGPNEAPDAAFPNVLNKLHGNSDAAKARQAPGAAGREGHQLPRNAARSDGSAVDRAGGETDPDTSAEISGAASDAADPAQTAADPHQANACDCGTPVASIEQIIAGTQTQSQEAQGSGQAARHRSGSATPSAVGMDASAGSDTASVREVEIVSVKHETHRAAVHTDAAALSFAERLALVQMTQRSAQSTGAMAQNAPGRLAGGTESEASSAPSKADASAGKARTGTKPSEEMSRGEFVAGGRIGQRSRSEDAAGNSQNGFGANAKNDRNREMAGVAQADAGKSATAGALDGAAATAGTPAQQLAGRIATTAQELQHAAQQAAAAHNAAGASAAQPLHAPVRVLNIDLHPQDLGSVTVRMSLVGDTLEVQIAAERGETAQMLRQDSDQITDMLRSAGLQVDGLVVRTVAAEGSASNSASGQSSGQQQSPSNGAQADARASQGQRGERDAANPREQNNRGREDETRNQHAAGSGLYV